MSAAATVAAVTVILVVATAVSVALAIWLPALTAAVLTPALAFDEARRGWRRWRATRKWARRLSS